MLLSVLAVIVVLSPIVIVHEFGHYLACRLTGIRVNEFAFGFGKILWHKKVGDTDYQIRAIPFGGFVEPAGPMFHPENAKEPPKPYEFAAQKWYAKFFMVVNGAVFNYVLAAIIFSVLIFIQGMPQTDPALLPAKVGSVAKNYPVETIDLKENDLIKSVDGKAVSSWQDLTDALKVRTGDLALDYERDGQPLSAVVKADAFRADAPSVLGITVAPAYYRVSPWKAVGYGLYQCYYWTKFSLKSLADSFTKKKAPDLAGPIGIVNIIHKSAHRSLLDFVFLIAMLSLAVGMFNLFPIPILDGGYALVYLAEGITHKLPTEKWLNIAANVGLYILILLVVYASYSDIKRIFFKPKAAAQEVQSAPEQPQTVEEQTAENSNSTEETYVQE